jgi:hypothetical protein
MVLTDPLMGLDGAAAGVVVGLRGSRVQRPLVALDLVPVSKMRSSRVIAASLWVKTALQP